MSDSRANTIDYTTNCTVCIIYVEGGVENRLVYERPQMQIPNRPLSTPERARIAQMPDDQTLTVEAKAIFAGMRGKARITPSANLRSIFIARTAAAALEMSL